MFIPNEIIFVATVDNYGLVIIDVARKEMIDSLSFNTLFDGFPSNFMIYNIIPVQTNGMRVLLRDMGAFTIFWKGITRVGDQPSIFEGLEATHRFITIENEITTNIVDVQNMGYVHIIYNLEKGGFFNGFVRLYGFMNHLYSKPFRDYSFGRISS
jgi:hypothetical protein